MFGTHFYHATMRKSVAVFGTLFNDISVIRKKTDGTVLNQIRVPLAYGPKQKFLARLDQETGFDAPMGIKLPRMAFEMTSLELDTNIKGNKMNKIVEDHASDVTKKKTISHYTSYNIGMQLNILTKNQDDGLQIVEQILPYFQPEYTVTITPVDSFTHKQDVPVVLTGVSIDDNYEGDFTERRVLTYTLDFTMKMKFYGPTADQNMIRSIELDFERQTPAEFYQGLNFSVGSSDTPSSFTVTTTRDTTQNPTSAGNTFTYTASVQAVNFDRTVNTDTTNTDDVILEYAQPENYIYPGNGMISKTLQSGSTFADTGGDGLLGVEAVQNAYSDNYQVNVDENVTVQAGDVLTTFANKYFIFDQRQPTLQFLHGNTYTINFPAAHPLNFSTVEDGTHNGGNAYITGVTSTSTSVTIVVDSNTPATLYYYCANHAGHGGRVTSAAS